MVVPTKKVAVLGAGQFGKTFTGLINKKGNKIVAIGDNNATLHGKSIDDIPVCSVEETVLLRPDLILIGVAGEERNLSLKKQVLDFGFEGTIIEGLTIQSPFDLRTLTIRKLAERIKDQDIPGCIAELGVFQGDTAAVLNALFPDRELYLFDTFDGFQSEDVETEQSEGFSDASIQDFSCTSGKKVLKKMPFPEKTTIKEGRFPETAEGLSTLRYAMVSLDADLYEPTFTGLSYFYPRLNDGGILILHDYDSGQYRGVKQAVEDFEKQIGSLKMLPLCDLHGTAVVIK